MNIFIMLAIVAANVIAIALVYQFIKKLPNKDKIIFIIASFAIIYIAVSIVYWISGFGIDDKINDVAKDFITYVFVPVNVIILVPFIATKYNKWKLEEIDKKEFSKRLLIVSIIGVIILIGECFYFKNMKNNIKLLNSAITEENSKSKDEGNEVNTNIVNETFVNQISTNEINQNNITVNENN